MDIEDLLKEFKNNPYMFTTDIPPGQDITSKTTYIFKSNAKSRDDIFNFIKAN